MLLLPFFRQPYSMLLYHTHSSSLYRLSFPVYTFVGTFSLVHTQFVFFSISKQRTGTPLSSHLACLHCCLKLIIARLRRQRRRWWWLRMCTFASLILLFLFLWFICLFALVFLVHNVCVIFSLFLSLSCSFASTFDTVLVPSKTFIHVWADDVTARASELAECVNLPK